MCDDQETMASVATTLSLIRSSLAASKAGSKYCETPRYEVSRSTRNRIKKNSIALASSKRIRTRLCYSVEARLLLLGTTEQ